MDFELPVSWSFVNNSTCILFVNIDFQSCSCPTIFLVFVSSDMVVTLFDSKQSQNSSEMAWLSGEDSKLTRWSQLPNICAHLNNVRQPLNAILIVDDYVTVIIKEHMKQLVHGSKTDQGDEDNKVAVRLKFLLKQFELLFLAQKRHSPDCLLLAFKIYCSSRPVYSYLHDS